MTLDVASLNTRSCRYTTRAHPMGPRRKDHDRRSRPSAASTPVVTKPQPQNKQESNLPLELQQLILDQFSRAFPFDDNAELQTVVQTVKGHLYNRDFANAFGKPEYLRAYIKRWSASRALGYADLLASMDFLQPWYNVSTHPPQKHILSLGGGAGAEVAAIAAVIARRSRVAVTTVDIADWSSALSELGTSLTAAPALSQYASESAKAANKPLVETENLNLEFTQHDVLNDWPGPLQELVRCVDLVTIMFTLNELFTASMSKTTKLLLELTERMHADSHLLVVDSPGSYSEITLGKTQDGEQPRTKQYPMKWLMDHTLMDVAKGKWEKVLEDESRWFRVNPGVRYPIDLENMRYQVHLYKRVS